MPSIDGIVAAPLSKVNVTTIITERAISLRLSVGYNLDSFYFNYYKSYGNVL